MENTTNDMELRIAAFNVAAKLHAGQRRRDGKTLYLNHLFKVSGIFTFGSAELEAVAWLHDSVEDGHTTLEESRTKYGFPEEVVAGVDTLTRRKDESYGAFIERIKTSHSGRFVPVKVSDILANLSDDPTPRQIRRYAAALLVLVPEGAERI